MCISAAYCPSYSNYRCRMGLCLRYGVYCNGTVECPDGSDEPPNCHSELLFSLLFEACSYILYTLQHNCTVTKLIDLSPTLCPITNLHIHKLFVCFFMHRIYSMRAIQTFCVHLLLFRYLLLSSSIVLFGLTTTRLNKTTTTTYLASVVITLS